MVALMLSIAKWPEQERPRERLLQHGAAALSNAELLAILIGQGKRDCSAIDVAHNMINQFGSLSAALSADFEAIRQVGGLGEAKYARLQAALELGSRYLKDTLQRDHVIDSMQDAKQLLVLQLRPQEREVFACLFLDNQYRVIEFEILFHGSIRSADIHPREVVKRALHHNAAAVIISHNHPSGNPEPSKADCELTKMLRAALSLVEVSLLDHIIVADTEAISMAEGGYL